MTFLPYYSTEIAIFCGHDRFCPMCFSAPFRSSGFVYKLIHYRIHFSVQDYMHFYPSVSCILSSFCPRQRTLTTIFRFRRIRTGLFITKKDALRRPDRFQRFDAHEILCSFVFSVIQKLSQRLPSGHPPCRASPRADPGHFFRNVRRLPSACKSAVSGSVPG